MKIYTKTGDQGATSLFGGTRVSKHNIRINAYGTVDELNAWIGLLRDQEIDARSRGALMQIQNHLFIMGAGLAAEPAKNKPGRSKKRPAITSITPEDIKLLEEEIDAMNETLPPLTHFVLPGGHPVVSFCHIARTVCRRAERTMVQLSENEVFDECFLPYINRLSDYLFVLARKLAAHYNVQEIMWIPKKHNKPV